VKRLWNKIIFLAKKYFLLFSPEMVRAGSSLTSAQKHHGQSGNFRFFPFELRHFVSSFIAYESGVCYAFHTPARTAGTLQHGSMDDGPNVIPL
jgi:hypothetical protein